MLKLFIIILLSTINLCYAQELEQPQPLVLNDKSNFFKGSDDDPGRVIFNEFTTGKKYCKHDTEDWDDQCQDAVMYHVYGENWREFKYVALQFVGALRKGDSEAIENLCGTLISGAPVTIFEISLVYRDGKMKHSTFISTNKDQFLHELQKDKRLLAMQSATLYSFSQYKDFKIHDLKNYDEPPYMPRYKINVSRGVTIGFEPEEKPGLVPKIFVITLYTYNN